MIYVYYTFSILTTVTSPLSLPTLPPLQHSPSLHLPLPHSHCKIKSTFLVVVCSNFRFYGVYNHVDFHARQRAAKLSVCSLAQ